MFNFSFFTVVTYKRFKAMLKRKRNNNSNAIKKKKNHVWRMITVGTAICHRHTASTYILLYFTYYVLSSSQHLWQLKHCHYKIPQRQQEKTRTIFIRVSCNFDDYCDITQSVALCPIVIMLENWTTSFTLYYCFL